MFPIVLGVVRDVVLRDRAGVRRFDYCFLQRFIDRVENSLGFSAVGADVELPVVHPKPVAIGRRPRGA